MIIWWQIIIFVALILALSLLKGRLVYEFAGSSLLLFGSSKLGIWIYSILFLPGTILHELSHWITAELLGVPTGAITILPDMDDGEVGTRRLGSVATASTGPLRSFAIGAAPFFTGLAVLYVLSQLLLHEGNALWQNALLIYGIIVTGSSMLLSQEDRRTWLPTTIFLILVSLILYKLSLLEIVLSFLYAPLSQINTILSISCFFILLFIGISYVFRRIIERLTGHKIVRSKSI